MLSAFAGGRVFGERLGEAPVRVLALHGWGRSREDFVASLRGVPAVAIDLPGFGASPPPETAWGSADYAALVARVAEELLAGAPASPAGAPPAVVGAPASPAGAPPAVVGAPASPAAAPPAAAGTPAPPSRLVVVGHSFGGCVAVQLAAARPDLVGALVLSGVPRLLHAEQLPPRPKASYRALRRLRQFRLVSEQRLEAARQRHGSPDYRNAVGIMRKIFVRLVAEDLEQQLRALTCPVQLLWGELDSDVPVAVARRAAGLLPRSTIEVLPGIGHLVPLEAPEALRAAVEFGAAQAGPGRPGGPGGPGRPGGPGGPGGSGGPGGPGSTARRLR